MREALRAAYWLFTGVGFLWMMLGCIGFAYDLVRWCERHRCERCHHVRIHRNAVGWCRYCATASLGNLT